MACGRLASSSHWATLQESGAGSLRYHTLPRPLSTRSFQCTARLNFQDLCGQNCIVFSNSLVLCPMGVRGRQRSEREGQTRTAVTQPFPLPQRAAAKFLLAPSAGSQATLGDPSELPLYRGEGSRKQRVAPVRAVSKPPALPAL